MSLYLTRSSQETTIAIAKHFQLKSMKHTTIVNIICNVARPRRVE